MPFAFSANHVPAELEHVIARDLALGVVQLEVERLVLLGHLAPAATALDRPEPVGIDTSARREAGPWRRGGHASAQAP